MNRPHMTGPATPVQKRSREAMSDKYVIALIWGII
jgi:hypothetical protein